MMGARMWSYVVMALGNSGGRVAGSSLEFTAQKRADSKQRSKTMYKHVSVAVELTLKTTIQQRRQVQQQQR